MKRSGFKVDIDHVALAKLKAASIQALEMTGDYTLDKVVQAEVIPFDKGTLQNEGTFVDKSNSKQGTVSLVSSTPYARRLYFHPEYNFQTKNNKNAKGLWFEDLDENGKYAKRIKKAYAHFLKDIGGL